MLKKIVKYGNSNALVLDKAILELLNMGEGSVVKISTDGKSLVITPHEKNVVERVHETFTSQDAIKLANIRNSFKGTDLEGNQEAEKELESLFEQNASLLQELLKNDEYRKELALLEKECSSDSSKFYENSKKLTEKYMPELQEIDEKISSFVTYKDVSEQEQSDIRKAFSSYFKDLFSKNQNIVIELNKAMSSPEYQHRAQLLAEKFADNKNSEEYINAQNELIYEFYPKIKELHRELAAISKGKK